MARILACGVATIDLVQLVKDYPSADDEVRADAQYLWRGGNATNTLVVLSQLGHEGHWLGTLAYDDLADVICADLDRYDIDYQSCPRYPGSATPTSHITLSKSPASRCIVHYRELPELSENDCIGADLSTFDWLHIEGRNIDVTKAFMEYVREHFPTLPVSLEIEKPRENIDQLIPLADYVLFNKHYAQANEHFSAESLLKALSSTQQNRVHVCAWGDEGASCRSPSGEFFHSPALRIEQVIDTRAAGDVFNAAWIDAMLSGEDLAAALEKACTLAGRKCAQLGLEGLVP